ncbi:hypothetical protein QJQ45_030400, partial [Haematococcus lacustris]
LPSLCDVGVSDRYAYVPVAQPELASFRCKVAECSGGGKATRSFAHARLLHKGMAWHSDSPKRRFELLVVGRQGSQGNAGSIGFRIKGSLDVDIIHFGEGPVLYCGTAMMMGAQFRQDGSVAEHTVQDDHGNAVMLSQMVEVRGHNTTPAALVAAMVSLSPPLASDQLPSLVLPAGQPALSVPFEKTPWSIINSMRRHHGGTNAWENHHAKGLLEYAAAKQSKCEFMRQAAQVTVKIGATTAFNRVALGRALPARLYTGPTAAGYLINRRRIDPRLTNLPAAALSGYTANRLMTLQWTGHILKTEPLSEDCILPMMNKTHSKETTAAQLERWTAGAIGPNAESIITAEDSRTFKLGPPRAPFNCIPAKYTEQRLPSDIPAILAAHASSPYLTDVATEHGVTLGRMNLILQEDQAQTCQYSTKATIHLQPHAGCQQLGLSHRERNSATPPALMRQAIHSAAAGIVLADMGAPCSSSAEWDAYAAKLGADQGNLAVLQALSPSAVTQGQAQQPPRQRLALACQLKRDMAGKGQVRPLSFSNVYGDVITPMRDAEGRYLELTYTHPITQQVGNAKPTNPTQTPAHHNRNVATTITVARSLYILANVDATQESSIKLRGSAAPQGAVLAFCTPEGHPLNQKRLETSAHLILIPASRQDALSMIAAMQQLRGLIQSAGSRTYLGIQSRWLGGGRRSREPVWLADIKDPIPGNPARTAAVTLAENFNTTGLHYTPDQGAFTLRAVVAMAKPSTMQDIPGANVLHDIQSAATDALVQARVATTGQLDYLKAVKDARAQVAQAAEETLEPEAPGGWGLRVPVQSDEMQPLPPSAPALPSSTAAPPPPTWGTSGKGKSLPPHAPAKASRGPTPAAQARGFPPGGRGNGSRGGSSRGNSSRGNSSRGSSGSLGDFDNLTIDTGTLAMPQAPLGQSGAGAGLDPAPGGAPGLAATTGK